MNVQYFQIFHKRMVNRWDIFPKSYDQHRTHITPTQYVHTLSVHVIICVSFQTINIGLCMRKYNSTCMWYILTTVLLCYIRMITIETNLSKFLLHMVMLHISVFRYVFLC